MSASEQPEIQRLRARVFALAKTLGLEGDEAVRQLRARAGVVSLKTLGLAGWQKLLASLTHKPSLDAPLDLPNASEGQNWKLRILKRELAWTEEHFRAFVRRTAGIDHERFLDVAGARKVIAGMEGILRHRKK